MADKVEYVAGEHESMLTHLDHMHHETREQTIARLEAALKVAKASGAGAASLATHEEAVTRTVTEAAPEPKAPKAKVKRKKAAKAAGPAKLSAADAQAVKVNQKRAAKARADAKASEAPEPTPAV